MHHGICALDEPANFGWHDGISGDSFTASRNLRCLRRFVNGSCASLYCAAIGAGSRSFDGQGNEPRCHPEADRPKRRAVPEDSCRQPLPQETESVPRTACCQTLPLTLGLTVGHLNRARVLSYSISRSKCNKAPERSRWMLRLSPDSLFQNCTFTGQLPRFPHLVRLVESITYVFSTPPRFRIPLSPPSSRI